LRRSGIVKDYARKFYKSSSWRKCRESYFNFKHGLCERCQGPGKIVHHKKYITPDNINDPDITLNFRNLELLCQDCHNREHHERNSPTVEGVMFDSNGDLIRR
jgi:5-methylcytosine-specific restriction endonuclease McrA